MTEICRQLWLLQMDDNWKTHLKQVQFIRTAVSLRGYAQKDPLTEYKLEGFELYKSMLDTVRRNTIYSIFIFERTNWQPPSEKQEEGGENEVEGELQSGDNGNGAAKTKGRGDKFRKRKERQVQLKQAGSSGDDTESEQNKEIDVSDAKLERQETQTLRG